MFYKVWISLLIFFIVEDFLKICVIGFNFLDKNFFIINFKFYNKYDKDIYWIISCLVFLVVGGILLFVIYV